MLRWSADGRFLFLQQIVGLTAVKINRLDLASRREELWKETEAGRSGGREDHGCGDHAGWERVRIFVPARYWHAVSGERAEVMVTCQSAVRDHQQRPARV